ncbi:MAG: diguanylate cyclase (GGDEF)-like protein/PAS domain S-box-containing protein [bacterium]|jgi:diguanylate cyclase (GGDEF)-like protein/PAS domain S-box-containing protein
MKLPVHNSEEKRLRTVKELEILDTEPEALFDNLVQIAASVCDVPISLITLIDENRQWFKANLGLDGISEVPREFSFCTHTIEREGVYEIPNAKTDPRFADNPLVTGSPEIQFYAGCPLRLSTGENVGTLCVIDKQPKYLNAHQREILVHLSAIAVKLLETRNLSRDSSEQENQLRLLCDGAPLGICKCDLTGSCDYVNTSWQTICDMSEADAMGFGWTKAIHPEDKKSVFTQWDKAIIAKSNVDIEFRIKHKDGAIKYVRAISNPLKSTIGSITGFVGSLEDVTNKKIQKEALRKSTMLLEQTGALADIGGWELDLKTETLLWSEQTYRIHGLPLTFKPQVNTAIDFYAPEARPVIRDAVERGIRDGRGWDLELPLIRADGAPIWVRAVGQVELSNGKAQRIYGAFQNITEKVIQRQAIEYAHEQITSATESGNIGVWDWNPLTNNLEWTPKMYALFGLKFNGEEVTYDLWANALHPDDRERAKNTLADAVKNKEVKDLDTEFKVLWPDGSIHNIRATAQITRDKSGQAQRVLGVNWDVTPLHSLRLELTEKHDLLQDTLQSIGDAVITADTDGCVTWLNPTAEQMTGWLSPDALGKPVCDVFRIISERSRNTRNCPVKSCIETEQVINPDNQSILSTRDGREFSVEESAAPIFSNSGDLLGSVLIFRDVTEQRKLSQEMRYRATHDSLTGLVNRIEFETQLQNALDDSYSKNIQHSLMFIDLDQFKLVNDACGHAEGDLLLQQIAKLLSNNIGSNGIIGRLGGDEFAVILDNCDTIQAEVIAQRICQCMDDYRFVHEERRFQIGTSIGLVPLDNRWTNIEAAIQAADSACYAAKDAGRNRVHLWFDTDSSTQARHEDTKWANKLAIALNENGFVLHAQRIGSLADEQSGLHAEVLIRMDDENGSLIPPNTFLPAAERFSIATRIDSWVLTTTTDLLSNHPDLSTIETLSVNLSAQSVGDMSFLETTLELFERVGNEVCKRICLDITETATVSNFTDVARFIKDVRAQDVRVALDHFGGNSASYGYLRNLEIDYIKIDGELINRGITDLIDAAAIRSIVDLANILNIPTLAANIDNQTTLDNVKHLGIDHVQGFHLHEPEPLENVLGLTSSSVCD